MPVSDLIAAWNAGGQPSGTSGTPITNGMDTAHKVSCVNSWTVAVSAHADVPITEVQGYLSAQGVLTAMQDWLTANTTPSLTRTAITELFRTLNSTRLSVIQMSDPATYTAVSSMIAAAQAAGVLSAGQSAALLAMANAPAVSWLSTIGIDRPLDIYLAQQAGLS